MLRGVFQKCLKLGINTEALLRYKEGLFIWLWGMQSTRIVLRIMDMIQLEDGLMDGLLTALVSKRLHGLASGYERGGCWGEYTSAVMVYDKCDSCQERCGLVCGLRIVVVRLLSEALVKV